MKAVILARVSTKEQEDGHSINAQTQRLREYCQRKNLRVIRTFELVESSTRGERKEFKAMLEFVQNQNETIAIVADAVDRVQRGFKESVLLDDLIRREVIELHFYREGMVLGKNSSSSDVMRWDFSVMGAKSYVLQLSENVKRSMEYKRKNGEWAAPAPVGYLNFRDPITGKSNLIIDHARAPLVVRVFEEYATGAYSINEMGKRAASWGLRNKTKNGKALSPSQIHNMLRNPFYHGQMRVNGQLYPHRYEPLITNDLYHRCEALRTSRKRTDAVKSTKHPFIFRGLLSCAVSGRKVTCDLKKGQYVYLICRDPNDHEKKLFISEAQVLKQIEQIFRSIQLPEELAESLCAHLKQSHNSEMLFHQHAISALEKESEQLREKQGRLLDLLLETRITQDVYDTKQQEFQQRQYEIHQELGAHHHADDSFKTTVSSLIALASRAHALFQSSKSDQKRRFISLLFSNLSLRGEKLEYALRSPFHLMVNVEGYENWLPILDTIRTKHFQDVMAIAVLLPHFKRTTIEAFG